jgi:hypothetical protein
MHRSSLALIAILALAACESTTTGPTAAAPTAAAITESHEQRVPIAGSLINPCNGEEVVVEGFAHFREAVGTTDDGTQYVYDSFVNTQGISGYGLVTGSRYNYIVVQNVVQDSDLVEPYASSQKISQTVRVVASGKTPNFSSHIVYTASFDGTDYTVDMKQNASSCK